MYILIIIFKTCINFYYIQTHKFQMKFVCFFIFKNISRQNRYLRRVGSERENTSLS